LRVRIVGKASQIANAVRDFPAAFHADFREVRPLAQQYLNESPPSERTIAPLARELRCVLGSWGAGKREAPELLGRDEFVRVLGDPKLHSVLQALGRRPLSSLGIVGGRRAFNGQPASENELDLFDSTLFLALHTLGERLFIQNTNVTYPMKAVLLITGLMPAFDRQVRTGLQRGGFAGMEKEQYLLPSDSSRADGKKITRLPFLLGRCWSDFATRLLEGLGNSPAPELVNEPGRVFDVLLFRQSTASVLVKLEPRTAGWYHLD